MKRCGIIAICGSLILLSACSSSVDNEDGAAQTTDGANSSNAATDAKACDGVTLSFLGLDGEQGTKELAAWRKQHNVNIQTTSTSDWSSTIAAIQAGQAYDFITMPYDQAQQMVAAKVVQPIDMSKVANWADEVPALQQTPDIRDSGGQVHGVPIAWGDGPFVYNPDKFTPPKNFSILDLLKPEWTGKFALFDSPGRTMYFVGKALGYNAPLYTDEQFKKVVDTDAKLVKNAAGFASNYEDGTAKLVSGDINLLINGWQSQLPDAAAKGVTLKFAYFKEGRTGWWDSLAIPKTAKHPDCARLYIDQMISPAAQAQLATNLVSGVANTKAIGLVTGVTKNFYDYSAVEDATTDAFEKMTPPTEVPAGIVPFQKWLDAWQEIKAG